MIRMDAGLHVVQPRVGVCISAQEMACERYSLGARTECRG